MVLFSNQIDLLIVKRIVNEYHCKFKTFITTLGLALAPEDLFQKRAEWIESLSEDVYQGLFHARILKMQEYLKCIIIAVSSTKNIAKSMKKLHAPYP